MTVEQAQKEFQILNLLVKKLIGLESDSSRKRVINFLLNMYAQDNEAGTSEIKTLGFCVGKLESLGRSEGQAIVKFLVDRFLPTRFEESAIEQNEIGE